MQDVELLLLLQSDWQWHLEVRNLFFNVPARRNFLKSQTVENKHLLEEFIRVALVNPNIAMEYSNNGKVVFNLSADSFQGRVCSLFNLNQEKDLIPLKESTEVVSIDGFIVIPEKAKRTRGLQYFFANGRFIRDPYLQHSVFSCYENIIEKDKFAAFFINLNVASEKIDVNIHPTKTEVKFEDSRFIYTILQSVVKKALSGRYTAPTPSLDPLFNINPDTERVPSIPVVKTNPQYSPFDSQPQKTKVPSKWENLYEPFKNESKPPEIRQALSEQIEANLGVEIYGLQQLHQRFILAHTSTGIFMIQQHHAHLRVLYDQFKTHQGRRATAQQLLFPVKVKLSAQGIHVLQHHLNYLNSLGFDIHHFNEQEFMVNAVPAQLSKVDINTVIEKCVDAIQNEEETKIQEKLLLSLARNAAIKKHQSLDQNEMNHLVKSLFEGENHAYTPDGKKILIPFDEQTIDSFF
jgi:DNA mismatch repair protein MutL